MVKFVSFRFQHCLIPFTMLLVEGSSETQLFRDLSNNVFRNPYSRKYISYEGRLFFENVQNLMFISKIEKKIKESFSF